MNLNLNKKQTEVLVNKGDILVFRNRLLATEGIISKTHYLIIEDKPNMNFTLLNLNNNNLMSSVTGENPIKLLARVRASFKKLEFVGVITEEEFELSMKETTRF